MISSLSSNTKAILLLTAPLIVSKARTPAPILTLAEYNRLARLLRDNQKQPADLIGPNANEILDFCAKQFERNRIENLLSRGFLLSQAVDRRNGRAIWVISRADESYPSRLKLRLKEDSPPILYGCGDPSILEAGGLAV